jgi:hypothetical protein
MVKVDTFLTTRYVMVDDFRQSQPPKGGPDASLSDSEVITTLAIFARWSRFASERDFYRYSRSCLRDAFPPPCPIARSSTGWCAREWTPSSRRRWWPIFLHLALTLDTPGAAYEAWTPRPCPSGTRSEGARAGWLPRHRLEWTKLL